jgi:hypothetical protein
MHTRDCQTVVPSTRRVNARIDICEQYHMAHFLISGLMRKGFTCEDYAD